MKVSDGWVVLAVMVALLVGVLTGIPQGKADKCRDAWLASHNAADSAVVARVCKVPR